MLNSNGKQAAGPPGGLYAWIIWAVASLFYLYEYFLRVAPSVMVHDLMVHFKLSAAGFGLLVAVYYYIYSPMQLVVGILLDKFGGRKTLPLAVGFAAFGAYIFGMSTNHLIAGSGRLLQGAGSAFAFVGALYVATNWFPSRRLGMLSGITTGLGMLGAAAGQAPLAYIVRDMGWQVAWIGAAIAGAILMVIMWIIIPNRPKWAQKQKTKHTPVPVFENLGKVFSNPQTWYSGLYGGLIYVPTSTFAALWGIPFLEGAYGLDRVTAAAAISMIFIGWALGAPLAGWWSDKIHRRKPPILISTLGVLFLSLAVIYIPNLNAVLLFVLMFLIGFFSGGQTACFAVSIEANKHNAKGSALALTNMLVMVTGAILQPVVGWLLDIKYRGQNIVGAKHFTAEDYHVALIVVPASVLLALVFAFLIKETHAKPAKI